MAIQTGSGESNLRFRCRDVEGYQSCPWEARGNNEADLMQQVEQHGRDAHGIKNFDESARDKVRNAMRPAA